MKGFERDYDKRLQALIARRTEPAQIYSKSARLSTVLNESGYYQASPIYEVYNKLGKEGSAVQYTVGAMARVDPTYTNITYEQGDRVKNQLEKALCESNAACDFEYQGSVTNDTHIKSHSDIDLLAITQRFWMLEPPQQPACPYDGDPIADLKEIRSISSSALKQAFPVAEVDDSGTKSVTICGGSLRRKIDIVPANWYDTNDYAHFKAKRFRSIEVLDVKKGHRIKNSPFMNNYLIETLDRKVSGGLRKVIRMLKSLKYDSGHVSLSSYDLAAIGYNMPEWQLVTSPGEEIALLARVKSYLDGLVVDPDRRNEMLVPDKSRRVFADGHATLTGLNELRDEVDDLVEAVCNNRQKSFAKLAEARLAY
jgi:hypothetical protein